MPSPRFLLIPTNFPKLSIPRPCTSSSSLLSKRTFFPPPAMSTTKTFKALVLGSGQGGTPLVSALAAAGHPTALVESTHIGGTCINEGCTPTKTMVASAKIAYHARRQAEFGIRSSSSSSSSSASSEVQVDMAVVRKRKRDIVESFRGGSESRLEHAENVTVVRGKARFVGQKEVEVELNGGGVERLKAEWVFINVGCRPAPLGVEGEDGVGVLDSTSVMELDKVPEHLVVVGGGYVGLEFAQMFRRFGSEVTVVQRSGKLLGREDPDIAAEVLKILEEDGIKVHFNTTPYSIKRLSPTSISLTLTNTPSNTTTTLTPSHVLAAAGRLPNTHDLGLNTAGVHVDKRGFVSTTDKLETNIPGIYALGDVKGGPAFTHISYDDFRILKRNVLEHGDASITGRLVPYGVFIDPQLGRVGMTESEAKAAGKKVRVAKMPMAWVARALEMAESRGVVKVIVEGKGEGDQILGAAVLGVEGGEVMSMLQIAMMGKVPYTVLRDGVFAHPLLAEGLNNLFGSLEER